MGIVRCYLGNQGQKIPKCKYMQLCKQSAVIQQCATCMCSESNKSGPIQVQLEGGSIGPTEGSDNTEPES